MLRFRTKPVIVEAVQWTGDDQAWVAICALHADSELVAFREDDGSVSVETIGRRVADYEDKTNPPNTAPQ
jgi:hypothetical protein